MRDGNELMLMKFKKEPSLDMKEEAATVDLFHQVPFPNVPTIITPERYSINLVTNLYLEMISSHLVEEEKEKKRKYS